MTRQLFTIGNDFDAAARRAVAEEADDRRRIEADMRTARGGDGPSPLPGPGDQVTGVEEHPELGARLALIREQAQAIESLHPELAKRLEVINQYSSTVKGLEQELEARLGLIYEQAQAIERLHHELEARLDVIQQIYEHVEAVDDLYRELEARSALIQWQDSELAARLVLLEWQDRALGEFRTVLMLLRASGVYRVMLSLGRWRWLDRRIRRALRA